MGLRCGWTQSYQKWYTGLLTEFTLFYMSLQIYFRLGELSILGRGRQKEREKEKKKKKKGEKTKGEGEEGR